MKKQRHKFDIECSENPAHVFPITVTFEEGKAGPKSMEVTCPLCDTMQTINFPQALNAPNTALRGMKD